MDAVRLLGRSEPSVCRTAALLRRKGLLEPESRELVLTAEGLALEQRLHRAGEQMQAVLERLGVPPDDMDVGMEEAVGLLSSEDSDHKYKSLFNISQRAVCTCLFPPRFADSP